MLEKKPTGRKRKKQVKFNLTEQEFKELQEICKSLNMTRTELMLSIIKEKAV